MRACSRASMRFLASAVLRLKRIDSLLDGHRAPREPSLVEFYRTTAFSRHGAVDTVAATPAFPIGNTEWLVALEGAEESEGMQSMPLGDASGSVEVASAERVDPSEPTCRSWSWSSPLPRTQTSASTSSSATPGGRGVRSPRRSTGSSVNEATHGRSLQAWHRERPKHEPMRFGATLGAYWVMTTGEPFAPPPPVPISGHSVELRSNPVPPRRTLASTTGAG